MFVFRQAFNHAIENCVNLLLAVLNDLEPAGISVRVRYYMDRVLLLRAIPWLEYGQLIFKRIDVYFRYWLTFLFGVVDYF